MASVGLSEQITLRSFSTILNNHPIEITTVLADGVPWVRGSDVAAALGYRQVQQAVRKHVDDEDRQKLEILRAFKTNTLLNCNEKEQIFINESGLYSLILMSKKDEAKAFKRWVTSEVLPTIRRTGAYTRSLADEDRAGECVGHSKLEDVQVEKAKANTMRVQMEAKLARLEAITAAVNLGEKMGFATTNYQRQAREAINDAMLPPGQSEDQMIDATQYLEMQGLSSEHVGVLTGEFGKALKLARLKIFGDTTKITMLRKTRT